MGQRIPLCLAVQPDLASVHDNGYRMAGDKVNDPAMDSYDAV